MKYLIVFVLCSILFFSCSDYSAEMHPGSVEMEKSIETEEYQVEPPRTAEPPPSSNDGLIAYNDQAQSEKENDKSNQQEQKKKRDTRKIIRKADLVVEVTDYESSMQQLRTAATQFDAEITSESENNSPYRFRNALVFRLPPEQLDGFIGKIENIAKIVNSKQISATDVTKRYLDLQTRLQAREATIKRYQELLQQAANVTEVLSVERELRKAIEDRDVIKGEIKYLNDRIGRSTVSLEVIQNLEYVSQREGFFSRIGDAFFDGWQGFLSFAVGVVAAWPFLIILVILIGLFRRYRRRKKAV